MRFEGPRYALHEIWPLFVRFISNTGCKHGDSKDVPIFAALRFVGEDGSLRNGKRVESETSISQTVKCWSSIALSYFLYQPRYSQRTYLISTQSSMSSFRNHRIVIASLFLPTIPVLGESGPPTPEQPIQDNVQSTISAVANRLVAANICTDPKPLRPSIITTSNHKRQLSANNGPLKSIVEDLKDKVTRLFFQLYSSTIHIHSYPSDPTSYSHSFTN